MGRDQARSLAYRFDNIHITGATAKVALQRMHNIFIAWLGIGAQKTSGGHDHAGGAKTALQAMALGEGLLDRVQIGVLTQAFHGADVATIGLQRKDCAGLDRDTVHQNVTTTALRRIAANMGAGEAEIVSQHAHQQAIGLDLELMFLTIHRQADAMHNRTP